MISNRPCTAVAGICNVCKIAKICRRRIRACLSSFCVDGHFGPKSLPDLTQPASVSQLLTALRGSGRRLRKARAWTRGRGARSCTLGGCEGSCATFPSDCKRQYSQKQTSRENVPLETSSREEKNWYDSQQITPQKCSEAMFPP